MIQSHLKKLFAGIHQVKFVDDGNLKTIVAVKSLEGETVQLNNPVIVTNNVEVNVVESQVSPFLQIYIDGVSFMRNFVSTS